jgi:hypothetical protein
VKAALIKRDAMPATLQELMDTANRIDQAQFLNYKSSMSLQLRSTNQSRISGTGQPTGGQQRANTQQSTPPTNNLLTMPGVNQTIHATTTQIKQEPIGQTRTFATYQERMVNTKCHNCQQMGHIARNCPQPRKA